MIKLSYKVVDVNEGMKCDDGIECDTNYEPICGTDGITYVNRCRLIRARCLNKFVHSSYHLYHFVEKAEKMPIKQSAIFFFGYSTQ